MYTCIEYLVASMYRCTYLDLFHAPSIKLRQLGFLAIPITFQNVLHNTHNIFITGISQYPNTFASLGVNKTLSIYQFNLIFIEGRKKGREEGRKVIVEGPATTGRNIASAGIL